MQAQQSHDLTMVKLLQDDPSFADDYLAACLEEINEPGGQEALLMALRQIAEARGMSTIAQEAGIQRESLYKALSPKGNPTLKTLLAVLQSMGMTLSINTKGHATA